MRIADILVASDDDDDYDHHLFSSRSILPCWIFPSKRSREHSSSKRKIAPSSTTESQSRRKPNELDQSLSIDLRRVGCEEQDENHCKSKSSPCVSSEMVDSSGRHIKDTSFSLGLGIGLVFLTALSKNEINKMLELKEQMETLIKEVKDEMQNKDVISMTSKSNDILISATTSSSGVGNTNNHPDNGNRASSHHLEEANINMECDSHSNCNTTRREDCKPEINQLEAELEAELEYMQFNLDVNNLLEHQEQHWKEGTGSDESLGTRVGEVEHPEEQDDGWEENGVSPIELERRLHELLEARQQERIKELESSLECAMDELRQKEMEISWWKNIAQQSLENVHDAIQS